MLAAGNATAVPPDTPVLAVPSAAAYKAAGSSASATAANVANTIALGENSIVDANKDGLPVSVTLGGASADGTIQLTMMYVVD